MNDFHNLSICIQNKDVVGAMRVLRDKSEFAVRKILEKLKIRVTTQTGVSDRVAAITANFSSLFLHA